MEAEIIEKQLVERSKAGDKEAFETLVKRYWKRAYFSALAFVGSPEDAMDLSQDAFVKTYRSISAFDTDRSFFPWFYTILKNLCLNFCRKRKSRRSLSVEQMLENGFQPAETSPQPDVLLERKQLRNAVWQALFELDEAQREILFLREFRELSYQEIAELLDCPKGTVMSRLYYARKALKAKLNGLM